MGLVLWIPCTKDLHNQGLVGTNPTGTCTYEAGKIGNCAKVTSTIDTGLSSDKWDYSTKSISFGGWFKFNKAEMQAAVLNKSTNTNQRYASFNLLGKNSYNGFALSLSTNNIYNPTADLTSLNIQASMRSSTALWICGFGTIEWDTWIHLFITWDFDSKTFTAYKNGIKMDSYTISNWGGNFTYRGAFNIADNAIFGGNGPAVIMPFRVNDVRVYDHCLSPKEVKEIAKGLVLHYPLNDAYVQSTTNLNKSIGTNWTNWGTNTITKDSFISPEGTTGSHIKCSSFTNGGIYTTHSSFSVKPNTTYVISAKMKLTGYTHSNLFYWREYDSSNTKLSESGKWSSTRFIEYGHGYKLYYGTVTTASTTSSVSLQSYLYGVGEYWIYDIQVEEGDYPTPFAGYNASRTATIVYDCSGYQNNGTISGSLSCSEDSPRYKTCVQTSSSGKIQKDIILPSAITQYTISVWCKITDPNAAANLWTKHSNGVKGIIKGPDGGWIYSYNGGGLLTNISFLTTSGTIAHAFPGFGQNCKDGNWHMYTIVGNGNINTCYLDGVITGRSTLSNFVSYNINGQLNIGLTEECLVSDYRVYATALSEEDIKELYNTSAYVLDNGTLLTYNLEE